MASLKKGGTGVRKGQSQLRSPLIKRSPTAGVTLQGWLHKQGSDGLMLWKKRWFVLSDYCLFYYKGPEEEKLLGSFLLASYKISACTAEDKVYRKYSFKAEHANMRTYYFAADNQGLMAQWMNALTLASILQESWDEKKNNRASLEDSDCGFHPSNVPGQPGHANSMNIWQPTQCQPLYANAPPKPRRLNETSSPERSPERHSEEGRVSRLAQPQEYPHKVYYQNRPPLILPNNQLATNNSERRTPDTYGRSKTSGNSMGKVISSKSRSSDYEDVYKQDAAYHPVRYRRSQNQRSIHSTSEGKRFPPRPHSADFLEYDNKRQLEMVAPRETVSLGRNSGQPQRPKSSLDMLYSNEHYMDSLHWSEESYARKMRQSSVYVTPQFPNSPRAVTQIMRSPANLRPPNYMNNNELASTIMRNHSEAIHLQERRWSEYLDSRDSNHFIRSASARLPRPQKDDNNDDDGSERSSITTYRRRNSTDSKDGTNKTQQREESMKRLLEWKQRMLQSPLTRKSSGSSTRGTAQNELSKYYKQQVLREIVNQDSRKSNNGNMGKDIQRTENHSNNNINNNNETSWPITGEPRKREEMSGKVTPGCYEGKNPCRWHDDYIKPRSRSQDGRNSVNRYNSYSSDDEEIEECRDREARKRFRKSSQGGRNRYNSSEGTSAPDYENIDASVNHKNNEERVDYKNYKITDETMFPNSNNKSSNAILDRNTTIKLEDNNASLQGFDSNQVVKGQYEDRLTISSKHSDSGYDTLQHGHLSQDSQVSDLVKFRFDSNNKTNWIPAYPFQVKPIPDENWGLKLDESRVIKEFSYHYIKSEKDDGKIGISKLTYGSPPNLVQDRIKAFETAKEIEHNTCGKEKNKHQGQGKTCPSSNQQIEDNSQFPRDTETPPFLLPRQSIAESPRNSPSEGKCHTHQRMKKNENSKSVRDLLADFEKKSQLAKEKLAVEEENCQDPGKRYVFSDTETLLYDTSSDADIEANESLLCNLRKPNAILSDEEDRDEEVAAVLGKQDNFVSSCRDLGRKRDSERRKRKTSKSSLGDGAFIRLSMTESVVAHDDVDSNCSTPLLASHKKENASKECNLDNQEEHYMPMTPRKKSVLSPTNEILSHTRGSCASHTLIMENLLDGEEENPYVEMTQNAISCSLLSPDNHYSPTISKMESESGNLSSNNPESPRYCEIGNSSTHYEFIFKTGINQEPVYMEVNSILDGNKDEGHKNLNDDGMLNFQENQKRDDIEDMELSSSAGRTTLPDILNSSAPSINHGSIKSDSSDADDEASKDLDSLDTPRHPRFSLSDTFRPASYYLGASIGERTLIGLTSEHQDSSDSDLVSPPPIPTSPPPLDDLESSLDSTISIKKISPLPLKVEACVNDNSEPLWSPTPLKGKELSSIQNTIDNLKSPNRHLEDLSSETDSVDSNIREKRLKRRPVSADILDSLSESNFIISSPSSGRKSRGSDLDSIGSRNGVAVYLDDGENIDFDQYLEDLQVPDQTCTVQRDFNYDGLGMSLKEKYESKESQCNEEGQKLFKQDSENQPNQMLPNSFLPSTSKVRSQDPRYVDVHYENLQCMFLPPPLPESAEGSNISERQLDHDITAREVPKDITQVGSRINVAFSDDKQSGAPYYYSDIIKIDGNNAHIDRTLLGPSSRSSRVQTLNNQRDNLIDGLPKRNDIGRKVNQINHFSVHDDHFDEESRFQAELKASAHLMAAGDKSEFDEKNIYVSDTLQRQKMKASGTSISRSQTPDFHGDARNLYPFGIRDKNLNPSSTPARGISEVQLRRRSRSLEGLLEDNDEYRSEPRHSRISPGNKIFRLLQTTQSQTQSTKEQCLSLQNIAESSSTIRVPPPPPDVWEEDTLWRENLRRVSIRHTRSLDDLDRDSGQQKDTSPSNSKDNQEVTYANGNIASSTKQSQQQYEEDYREGRKNKKPPEDLDDGVHYERLVRDTESLERIRRGQSYIEGYVWDEEHEMFRRGEKPPNNKKKPVQSFLEAGLYPTRPPSFEIDREKLRQWDLMSSAPSGMLSAGRVTATKSCPDQQPTPPNSPGSGSGWELLSPRQIITDQPSLHSSKTETWNLNVSAGELLGRTHEELVLLLIQLRRQSAGLCKAMESCHREIETQARLTDLDTPKRIEHLKKLDELRRHLLELEKQYEKGKPLVNLVDNMVKLGSLYRAGSSSGLIPQRLEFNQKVQEQRLLAEERRDWERISPDHNQLQAKVEQLYRLDRLLQEESGTLHSLQQDKEMLERALGGLRQKLQGLHGNPAETERYRRQQRMLEKELTRVRSILAQNSKKLEETVAENARLEQELVVLRQKLQWSRRCAEPGGTTTAALEAELQRVQMLVGDLQRQRQELSLQVRHLTEKSQSLSQQIRPGPAGVGALTGTTSSQGKKRSVSCWLETDLDSQMTQDIGIETPCSSPSQLTPSISPLYVNTDPIDKTIQDRNTFDGSTFNDESSETIASPTLIQMQFGRSTDTVEPDDRIKRYYGFTPKDKPQEIKTVRIVKRESERRQRDRDRSGSLGIPLTNTNTKRVTIMEETLVCDNLEREENEVLMGEEISSSQELLQTPVQQNAPPPTPGPRSDSVIAVKNIVNRQMKGDGEVGRLTTAREQLFVGSPQLSPVYLSEAARQIVEEVAWGGRGGRRLIPKEKRRHHTVSGQSFNRSYTPYSPGGSRDDLDMERALRPRLNTPDVVRSTLSRTDPKFTTETIDSVLGTPGKIIIPERYIPENGPQLSQEEQQKRSKKADAIRKMLSETTTIASAELIDVEDKDDKSTTLKKKVAEEKRHREHLLQLNQILAHQVMEKSKIVAGVNSTVTLD